MIRYLSLLVIVVLGLSWLVACGHVTIGSSGGAVATSPAIDDWQYQAQPQYQVPDWPYESSIYSPYHKTSRTGLTDAEAAVYQKLSHDLSDALAAYRPVGVAGYSHIWPLLERDRIKLLTLSYNSGFSQMFRWNYENIGDFDLNGGVNSIDLFPVALYADAPFARNNYEPAIRDWLDTNGDGLLDRYNAQQIAMSYGRTVLGYNVLAGLNPDPTSMDTMGLVRFADRLPGWPPHFELLIPAGYSYVCLQPVDSKKRVICSYIAALTDNPHDITVLYPEQPANLTQAEITH
jgi:hypothetical protein